jgi:methanethiol S-methyltransferase
MLMPLSEHNAPISHRRRAIMATGYGLLCHTAFALSVGLMIFSMYKGMTVGWGPFGRPWNWLANGLLNLQFPLLHSFLLSARGRGWLKRLAPGGYGEQLSTTTYVTIAALQVLLLFALWSPSGTLWWEAEGITRGLLTVLYAGAWLMLFRSMVDAGLGLQTGAIGWLAVRRGVKPVYPPMPSKGLFRLCRQPIYFSFALTLWTVPVWTPDQLFLAVPLTAYCILGPLFKEKRFQQFYKADFEAYQRRVPYWLPWPRPREKAKTTTEAAHAE